MGLGLDSQIPDHCVWRITGFGSLGLAYCECGSFSDSKTLGLMVIPTSDIGSFVVFFPDV